MAAWCVWAALGLALLGVVGCQMMPVKDPVLYARSSSPAASVIEVESGGVSRFLELPPGAVGAAHHGKASGITVSLLDEDCRQVQKYTFDLGRDEILDIAEGSFGLTNGADELELVREAPQVELQVTEKCTSPASSTE